MSGLLSIGGLLLLFIVISALLISRAFCRYLCPLGGLFAILSGFRVFKIKKRSTCVDCALCTKKCDMGIDVNAETSQFGKVVSGECIDCFACISTCAPKALYANPKEVVVGTAAAFSIAGLYYIGNAIPPSQSNVVLSAPDEATIPEGTAGIVSNQAVIPEDTVGTTSNQAVIPPSTQQQEETVLPEVQGIYEDGTYTGSGSGYRGTTSVSVVVSGGKITSITVDSTDDDARFMNMAKSSIIDSILLSQGLDVPTVSGATFSSNGILEAVSNALQVDFTNSNPANSGNPGRERHRRHL